MTSSEPGPSGARAMQDSQTPQGVEVGPCAQFSDRARIRADEVLPQPRGPLNRYAWLIRPPSTAFISGVVTGSCPTTSAKVAGRYLRESARATVGRLRGSEDSPGATPAGPGGPVAGPSEDSRWVSRGSATRGAPPRPRQSPLILAAFRPWGGSQDDATRGVWPPL